MDSEKTTRPLKAEAARRQLGTALHLWLADADPTSVHVLVCGGAELAEALAREALGAPFVDFALAVHPDLTMASLHKLRTRLWNAMKHANGKSGAMRDDETLLSEPLDEENEARLGAAWFDLSQVGVPLPVEAQMFNLWFLAKHGNLEELGNWQEELFPSLRTLLPKEQKELLRWQISIWRNDSNLLAHPGTDRRPLVVINSGESV